MRARLPAMVLITALFLSAADSFASARESISIWFSAPVGPGTNTMFQLIDEFQQSHPDVEVEAVERSYATIREQLIVALAGGAPPNIAMFAVVDVVRFADIEALLPLNDYLAREAGMLEDFFPQMLEAATFGGQLYGLPYNASTAVQYRNMDLFRNQGLSDEAPATWDEIAAVLPRLTHDRDGDQEPDVFGGFYQHNWNFLFDQWVFQNGGSIMGEDGDEFAFNSPEAVGAMEFLQELMHVRRAATTGTGGAGNTMFLAGEIGMKRSSTAQLGRFIEDSDFDLGVAPLACNVRCWASLSGGTFTMIHTGTQAERDASWELIKFLYDPVNLARYSIASGYMVSRRAAFDTELMQATFLDDPRYRVSYTQVDIGGPRDGALVPFWPEVQAEIRAAGSVMFRENGFVKGALDSAVEVSNARLREYLRSTGRTSVYDW